MVKDKPPIGVKPGWLHAVERISELAEAINRYATDEHGWESRFMIRLLADEIKMQLDICDKLTIAEELFMTEEGE